LDILCIIIDISADNHYNKPLTNIAVDGLIYKLIHMNNLKIKYLDARLGKQVRVLHGPAAVLEEFSMVCHWSLMLGRF